MDTYCFLLWQPAGVMAVVETDSSISSSSVSKDDPEYTAEGTAGAVAATVAGVSRAVVVVGTFRVGSGMVWRAAAAEAIVTSTAWSVVQAAAGVGLGVSCIIVFSLSSSSSAAPWSNSSWYCMPQCRVVLYAYCRGFCRQRRRLRWWRRRIPIYIYI